MEIRGNEEIGLVDLLKIHGTSENPEKNVGSPTSGLIESFGGVSADHGDARAPTGHDTNGTAIPFERI